jgi:hypothetical protein
MRTKLSLLLFILLVCTCAVFAQHGGKAEPNEIKFAAGKSNATVSGTLANHQEMEYSFTANAGQTVYLKCGSQFDFRLFKAGDGSGDDFDTEWNSGADSFELPADGEYLLSVRKKLSKVRSARFYLTITIK